MIAFIPLMILALWLSVRSLNRAERKLPHVHNGSCYHAPENHK